MERPSKCAVCEKPRDLKGDVCGICRDVYYCSSKCEDDHWDEHKKVCGLLPYRVAYKKDGTAEVIDTEPPMPPVAPPPVTGVPGGGATPVTAKEAPRVRMGYGASMADQGRFREYGFWDTGNGQYRPIRFPIAEPCAHCKRARDSSGKECSVTCRTYYCSETCVEKDWERHRDTCTCAHRHKYEHEAKLYQSQLAKFAAEGRKGPAPESLPSMESIAAGEAAARAAAARAKVSYPVNRDTDCSHQARGYWNELRGEYRPIRMKWAALNFAGSMEHGDICKKACVSESSDTRVHSTPVPTTTASKLQPLEEPFEPINIGEPRPPERNLPRSLLTMEDMARMALASPGEASVPEDHIYN